MTQSHRICCTCGAAAAEGLCAPCWQESQHDAAERQAEALAAGRRALAEGRPVIMVHGRPYADPDWRD